MMRAKILLTAAVLLAATPAFAADLVDMVVFVNGNVGPWSTTLNPTLDYGKHDNADPVVLNTIFDFQENSPFTIFYLGGKTSPYGGTPYAKGIGDTTYLADAGVGSTGFPFPSKYIDSAQYPAYLNAVIGAFTDGSGVVVGTPFLIGNEITVYAPAGAAALQFGFNDDKFSDNSGQLLLGILGNPAPTPEPAAWALMIAGFGMAGMAMRRQRKVTVSYT